MANYDNKLGEWFKKVEAKEQELKARKSGADPAYGEEAGQPVEESVGVPRVAGVQIQGPAREAPMSVVATMETSGVIADTSLAGALEPAGDQESAAPLFAEEEVPKVPDFFSYLNRSSENPVVEEVEERVYELPKDQGSLSLSEGTGEPRPVTPAPPAQPAPPPVQAQQELVMTPPAPARIEAPKPVEVRQAGRAHRHRRDPGELGPRAKHLQTLFGASVHGSRPELIQGIQGIPRRTYPAASRSDESASKKQQEFSTYVRQPCGATPIAECSSTTAPPATSAGSGSPMSWRLWKTAHGEAQQRRECLMV